MFRRRISLRAFLAACMAIAVLLGIARNFVLGPLMARADAETELIRIGATIKRGRASYYLPDPRFPRRRPPDTYPDATRAEKLLSFITQREITFSKVTEISFWTAHRYVTDKDMDLVLHFPEVEELDLTLGKVWELPNGGHGSTNIGSKEVTDLGVAKIAGLPNLRVLRLGECNLSDASLEALSKSQSLEMVGLQLSRVTDAGLLALADVQSLTDVWIVNNKGITADGVREFCRQRPDVAISSGFTGTELSLNSPMPRPSRDMPRPPRFR
jgi:hypothetical protein